MKPNNIHIRIRSFLGNRIIFVFVFGHQNTIRSPLDDGDADEGGFEGICKLDRDQTAIGSSAKSAVSTLHPSLDYLDYEEDSFLIFPSKHTFNTNLTAVHHSVVLTTVSTSTIWCNLVGLDSDLRYDMEQPVTPS